VLFTHPPEKGYTLTSNDGVFQGNKAIEVAKKGFEYAAGKAALEAVRAQESVLKKAAETLGVAPAQLPSATERLAAEWREQRHELEKVRAELAGAAAKNLLEGATTIGGWKVVVRRIEGEMKDLMALSKQICEDPKAVAILAATSGSEVSLIVSHGPDVPLDGREALDEAARAVGGKGGGRADFAQGAGPRTEAVEAALNVALEKVRDRLAVEPSG